MTEKRLFTEDELKELTKTGLEQILDAVKAGDPEKAEKVIRRVHKEYQGLMIFIGLDHSPALLYRPPLWR